MLSTLRDTPQSASSGRGGWRQRSRATSLECYMYPYVVSKAVPAADPWERGRLHVKTLLWYSSRTRIQSSRARIVFARLYCALVQDSNFIELRYTFLADMRHSSTLNLCPSPLFLRPAFLMPSFLLLYSFPSCRLVHTHIVSLGRSTGKTILSRGDGTDRLGGWGDDFSGTGQILPHGAAGRKQFTNDRKDRGVRQRGLPQCSVRA